MPVIKNNEVRSPLTGKPVSKPTTDPLALEIQGLRQENEALKAKASQGSAATSFKVAEKGGVSMYGVGRFPFTAYAFTKAGVFEGSQWHKLLLACGGDASKSPLVAFVRANEGEIKRRMAASLAAKASAAGNAAEAEAL